VHSLMFKDTAAMVGMNGKGRVADKP